MIPIERVPPAKELQLDNLHKRPCEFLASLPQGATRKFRIKCSFLLELNVLIVRLNTQNPIRLDYSTLSIENHYKAYRICCNFRATTVTSRQKDRLMLPSALPPDKASQSIIRQQTVAMEKVCNSPVTCQCVKSHLDDRYSAR